MNPKKTRNWDKGDWVTFTGKLKNMTFYEPRVVTEEKLDNILKQMYKTLFSIPNETCPRKCRKLRPKANTWYTTKHKNLSLIHI